MSSLLVIIATLGALFVGVEGVNYLSGGEFYLASIQNLVQQEAQEPALLPPPLPPPTTDQQPLPVQPVPQRPPQMPPPEGPQPQQMPPPPKPGMPEGQLEGQPEEQPEMEEWLDPREIQQVVMEIKRMKSELKRFGAQLRKLKENGALAAEIGEILQAVENIQNVLSSSADNFEKREAIQEFREENYWERVNGIRIRIELPRQIKQFNANIKRLEKVMRTKAVQNLGLDLERAKAAIEEMKRQLQEAQSFLQSGDFEEAQAALQDFHESVNPGEIESVIFRVRELKTMLKRLRDANARAQVENVLQEVTNLFNAGEYREAREFIDEQMRGIWQLLNQGQRRK